MARESRSPISVTVTLLSQPDCPTCKDLLVELEPLRRGQGIRFDVIDLSVTSPPDFAQTIIVPATYVDGQLWRHGMFPRQELAERLQQGSDRTLRA